MWMELVSKWSAAGLIGLWGGWWTKDYTGCWRLFLSISSSTWTWPLRDVSAGYWSLLTLQTMPEKCVIVPEWERMVLQKKGLWRDDPDTVQHLSLGKGGALLGWSLPDMILQVQVGALRGTRCRRSFHSWAATHSRGALSSSLIVSIHMQSKIEGFGIRSALMLPQAKQWLGAMFILGLYALAEEEVAM